MIETEIQKLREAIEANTIALCNLIPATKATKATKTVKAKKPKVEAESASDTLTVQKARDLAAKLIAAGTKRKVIKQMITALERDSISELDSNELSIFYNHLLGLVKPEVESNE